MRYFTEEPIVISKKPLYEIWLRQGEDRQRWYEKAFDLFGVPFVTDCWMPPVTFMLAYCIARARGLMASGNWLLLPFEYHMVDTLQDDQILFSGPFIQHGWGLLSGSEPLSFERIEEAVTEIHNEMPDLPPIS